MSSRSEAVAKALTTEASHWYVEDRDGTTMMVGRIGQDSVLIEHDGQRWVCSEDGPQQVAGTSSPTCPHVMAGTRAMPLDVALNLASRIAKPRGRTLSATTKTPSERKAERARTARLEIGAEKRARCAAEHDASFVAATEVMVRKMTDADRARLAQARARKARTYEQPDRMGRFAT